jgi:NhaP-type Na+/H+ and K+/H+ antiporter
MIKRSSSIVNTINIYIFGMILVMSNAHATNVTNKIGCYFLIVFLSISILENEQEAPLGCSFY